MTEQQPSVGRIVHVVSYRGECQAAIVTEVATATVISVMTFAARGNPYPQTALDYATDHAASSWHWPERA